MVTPLRERKFPVLVEHAKSAEHLEKGPGPVVRHQRNVVEARQMKKPYSRPPTTSGDFKCFQCGGAHLKRNCPELKSQTDGQVSSYRCFICDQVGHFANQCQDKKTNAAKKPPAIVSERPRAAGRVFALTTTEARQSGNLILEPCVLFGKSVMVLFDSEATHSFISDACVSKLSLEKHDWDCELLVSTPSPGQVVTSLVCVGCLMEVVGRRFKVNLICLPMEGLDVILGMDWLSSNQIVIDYGRRSVIFPETLGLELISAQKAIKEVEAGATCFMIVAQGEKKSTTKQIRSIPVVDKYVDVFPNEIPKLLPSRDVDFAIDIIPGPRLVSMALYRMVLVELAELKK